MALKDKPANWAKKSSRKASKPREVRQRFNAPAKVTASFPSDKAMIDFIGRAVSGGVEVTTADGQKLKIRLL